MTWPAPTFNSDHRSAARRPDRIDVIGYGSVHKAHAYRQAHHGVHPLRLGRAGRVHASLIGNLRLVAWSNVLAAASFVIGCIGFYWPRTYVASVTAFLFGSVVFLLSAVSSALADGTAVPSARKTPRPRR
jgi:hypothetical protein